MKQKKSKSNTKSSNTGWRVLWLDWLERNLRCFHSFYYYMTLRKKGIVQHIYS